MSQRLILGLAALLLAGISFAVGATLPTVPAAAAEPAPSYGAASLLQAGLGLALVLTLIFLCAWAVRRFGLQPRGDERLLKIISSVMVGQRERVVVVEIGGSWLVLGVAAGQVQNLHTMPAGSRSDARASQAGNGEAPAGAFSRTLHESLNHLKKLRKQD